MAFDPPPRLFVVFGALCAAFGVALSAYAAHAVQGVAAAQLSTAAQFALLHGIALAALVPVTPRRVGRIALAMLALGTLLFSGSLVAHHAFALPTRLAPIGGSLLIAGWLLYAVGALRR